MNRGLTKVVEDAAAKPSMARRGVHARPPARRDTPAVLMQAGEVGQLIAWTVSASLTV